MKWVEGTIVILSLKQMSQLVLHPHSCNQPQVENSPNNIYKIIL